LAQYKRSCHQTAIDISRRSFMHAGDLRLKYDIPTIDSIIAATCISENIKHILTYDRRHFESIKKIKIIDLKMAINMAK
jgi:predicted nucleic acid-binding protein